VQLGYVFYALLYFRDRISAAPHYYVECIFLWLFVEMLVNNKEILPNICIDCAVAIQRINILVGLKTILALRAVLP
jgi:hypothetical protein